MLTGQYDRISCLMEHPSHDSLGTLVVGFGDFEPTKTSTRIVLFPLALLGIAQLGSILSLIVGWFSSRVAQRKAQSRALSERERQIEQDKKQHNPDLLAEIEFLVKLNSKQDMKDQMSELAFSVLGFLVFWMVGAAIFMGTEVRCIEMFKGAPFVRSPN